MCKEGACFTVQINMKFAVSPKRMIGGHTIPNMIHSFRKYTKGSKLDRLRRSTVWEHVEFMTTQDFRRQFMKGILYGKPQVRWKDTSIHYGKITDC